MCPLVLRDLTVQKKSSSVKQQRTKKVFEGHMEVKVGLNATVDPSLRTVSDAAFNITVRQLLMDLFPDVAAVLEKYLSEDTSNASQVDSRTAIRSALSTPHTFFHILLYQIVPHVTQFASHCMSSSWFISTVYSDFCHFIQERRHLSLDSFVYIFDAMEHTAELKARLREIKPKIMRSGIFNSHNSRIHVHRLTAFQTLADVQESPAYGKIPVLRTLDDRLDPNRFPSDGYYHLPTSSDNTIHVRRIASLKFGEFDEFGYIPQKFRYILEELTDSSQLTQKCIFGEFGEFCIFCIFGCIRATFCSIPLCTLFFFFLSLAD